MTGSGGLFSSSGSPSGLLGGVVAFLYSQVFLVSGAAGLIVWVAALFGLAAPFAEPVVRQNYQTFKIIQIRTMAAADGSLWRGLSPNNEPAEVTLAKFPALFGVTKEDYQALIDDTLARTPKGSFYWEILTFERKNNFPPPTDSPAEP